MAEKKISLSFRLTWINTILTLGGSFGVAATIFYFETITRSENQLLKDQLNFCDAISVTLDKCLEILQLIDIMSYCYLFVFGLALIPLLLIQFLDKCSCFCCRCFKENCLPMTEKAVYDTENPFEY